VAVSIEIEGFRREQGLLWPAYDRRCAEVTFRETGRLIHEIRERTEQGSVAVQAGGNCGQLVLELYKHFDRIYTFEPDRQNFTALTVNTAHLGGVYRFQAALGSNARQLRGMADGDRKYQGLNCGALYMTGSGGIPTLTIDDLALPRCDLIMLDIEGGEAMAILGAANTIERCKPLVVLEDKSLGTKFYGEELGFARRLLAGQHDYEQVFHLDNDYFMSPR
jgi:FkbM family methyltransferase